MLKQISLYVMAVLYIIAGINHFIHPGFYIKIIPPYLPQPGLMNIIAGISEICLGVLLCLRYTQRFSAIGISVMLVLFMSVHIYMLQQSIKHEYGSISQQMAVLRILLQPLLIGWSLWYIK